MAKAAKAKVANKSQASSFASSFASRLSCGLSFALITILCAALLTNDLSHITLAKGAKAPAKAAPRQVIYSLSQEQKNSEVLKVWGVPACVLMSGERPRGLYITGFTGEGLGNELGLEIGDVLLSLNGHVLLDARQADNVLTHTRSGQLKAVIARAANVPGGITLLSPSVRYTADALNQSYSSEASNHSTSTTSVRDNPTEMTVSALEDYMFGLVNEDRAANGALPPLKRSSELNALARRYAEDMKKRNFFAHEDPDGLSPVGRARKAGIQASIWENLAMQSGNRDYKGLVHRGEWQMMNEAPNVPTNHRGCILSEHHHCVGIGVAVAETKVYCVQEFSPADIP